MTGDSCMARAVVPRTAAAVDHADTELIGHDGQLETPGFFAVVYFVCLHTFKSQNSSLKSLLPV